MGLKDLRFILDNPNQTYYCGQVVSGRLFIDIDSPKKLRSIIIKFKGEAHCHWTESRSVTRNGERKTETRHFHGHEEYFNHQIKVFGGNGEEHLPTGEHIYSFAMTLPLNLPSSFEGNYGYIRYTVKATLDRPWRFDHEVKAAFTVLSNVDLNLDYQNREAVKMEKTKYFCCCCCKSGPLTLASHIPVRGYVPGQKIPITLEVDNASNVLIRHVEIELTKAVTYHTTPPYKSKYTEVEVAKFILDGSVGENNSRSWTHNFDIPPLPPSILRDCNIIDLEYKLKIKAKPEGMHQTLENCTPITIGTIPLWQAPQTQMMFYPSPSAPPMEDSTMTSPYSSYPDMPPPTYQETMFGTKSIGDDDDSDHVLGTNGYNPRYPTYNLIGWTPPT